MELWIDISDQRASGGHSAKTPKLEQMGFTDLVTKTGLRLYALRLSPRVVVLFDGERKTTEKNQEKGSKVSVKWQDAKSIAARIHSKREGFLVSEGYLVDQEELWITFSFKSVS